MADDDLSPDAERQIERAIGTVLWVITACVSVLVVALTIVGVILLWRLV